ncbi:MAG: hypothetical protein PVI07_07065 [Anaerolineae bacterium]|jgi:hypothetical protein
MGLLLAVLVALLTGLLSGGATHVRATSFVVRSDADDANAHDANPGDGLCADGQGRCTLRTAIEEANALPGADTITFYQAMHITVDAGVGFLPDLTEQVTIDATSMWGPVIGPSVILDGGGAIDSGLDLSADGCQVYGHYITDFTTVAVFVSSANNTIGGSGAGQRNVITSSFVGVWIATAAAHDNLVQNNYIGVDINGEAAEANDVGLMINNGASDNTVGGATAALGNVISGNACSGVSIGGQAPTATSWAAT